MKKNIIIVIIFLLSLFTASINDSLINNSEIMVPLMFTLLGLCFTGYTFIYTPILQILNRKEKNLLTKDNLKNLLNSYQKDMILIFFLSIFVIIIDSTYDYDYPIFKNVYNLDLGIIYIVSLKTYILNFIISMCSCFSLYALYDIIDATFKILKNSLEK